MREVLVEEAMTGDPITVYPDTSVTDVAKIMVDSRVGGLPVVNEEGDLLGIVTESDLVVQESDVEFPSFVSFLSGYVFVPGSLHRFEEKFRRAVAATAGCATRGGGPAVTPVASRRCRASSTLHFSCAAMASSKCSPRAASRATPTTPASSGVT